MPDAIYKCHFNNTKAFPEGSRLKQVLQAVVTGIFLLVTLLFLLLGVASITETSCQTVDSGQAEDTRWSEESSPLHWCAREGNENLCRLLLKHNADVNIQDAYGNTPLHWCAIVYTLVNTTDHV